MSLLKKRPHLSMRLPRAFAGSPLTARLIVEAEREIPVSAITVHLVGREQCNYHVGSTDIIRKGAELAGPHVMTAGRHEFECRFHLPATLPPSYPGQRLQISYAIEARVDIPWWPDAYQCWVLELDTVRSDTPPLPRPLVATTLTDTTPADAPQLELSLGHQTFQVGGPISGAFALSNVAELRQRSVEVRLIAREFTGAAGSDDLQVVRRSLVMASSPVADGATVPFSAHLSRTLTPSFRSADGGVRWLVQAVAQIADADDLIVELPVELTPVAGRAQRDRVAVPMIGSERLHAVWNRVETRSGLAYKQGRLVGTQDGSALELRREARGPRRLLVGELRFRSLRIGLRAALTNALLDRARGLRPSARGEDSAYDIDARDPAQASHLLAALATELRALPQATLADDLARFELEDGGHHEERLLAFASALLAFARALPAARLDMPPPQQLAPGLAHWGALASTLEGTLEAADMSISGQLGGAAVELRADWARSTVRLLPPGLVVQVRPSFHLGTEWHVEGLADLAATPPSYQKTLPPAAAELMRRVLAGGDNATLSIARGAVALALPSAPLDPRPLRPRLDLLLELATMLRAGATPYR